MHPLSKVIRRLDGSHLTACPATEQTYIRPDSPSIIVSRTSAPVGAINAMRPTRSLIRRAYSAPVRVFPEPRPPLRNQENHSDPGGGHWSPRACGYG